MKKIFTLAAAMFIMTSVSAQTNTEKEVEVVNQENIEEFLDNYVLSRGISSDGRYVWGNLGADIPACIYDTQTGGPMIVLEPELDLSLGVNIAGITYDGFAFVSENDITYIYDINSGTRSYVHSSSEYGMDVWDVTADGRFFAGNITDESGYFCEPLYGEQQEDGSFNMIQLDFPKEDAMGCLAQFSQARFISEDGKYIMGIQADARGMAGRLLVWTKQDDGTFTYTTPLDDFIYDKSVGQPGETPEFEDYVTADYDTETDLWNEQHEAFNKAFDDFVKKYNEYTRHSALDIFMMHRAKRDAIIYAGVDKAVKSEGAEDYDAVVTYPIMYNCATGEVIANENLVGHAFEQLPGGGYITFDNSSQMLYATNVVKEDGSSQEFSVWFNEMTGVDLSKDFYFELTNPFTGEEFVGVYVGLPYFSHNGKTLMLSATDADFNLCTGVYNFDRDIFATTATSIRPNLINKIVFANNIINIGDGNNGTAIVYNANGAKCGEYVVNGSADLSNMTPGAYIVNVSTDNGNATLKVIVK